MNNHIITTPASRIREAARASLAGRWQEAAIFMAVYYAVSTLVSQILGLFFSLSKEVLVMGQLVPVSLSYGSSIYSFLISGPIAFGSALFFLAFFRRQKTDVGMLFEGFSHFGRAFILMLLMSVKIFLWSMLFIIPGIIATLRYSQAFFVMVDHPDYSASECIDESKRLMLGNKGGFFYLNLTFLGWAILASIPGALLDRLATGGVLNIVLGFIVSIPLFFLDAYINTTMVVYYEMANDNLAIVAGRPEEYGTYTEMDEGDGQDRPPYDEL